MSKIVIVGLNPSKLNTDPNIPFIGSKSYPILLSWLDILNLPNYTILNLSNSIEASYKPTKTDIAAFLPQLAEYDIVICLGNAVYSSLQPHCRVLFKLPHPSPRNRKNNNRSFIRAQLEECRRFIENHMY